MGTLFDQPRNRRQYTRQTVVDSVYFIDGIAQETEKTFDQVLKVVEMMEEARYNELYLDNCDIFDEQVGGLSDILDGGVKALASLTDDEDPEI